MRQDARACLHPFSPPRAGVGALTIRETQTSEATRFEILLGGAPAGDFQLAWPAHQSRFVRRLTVGDATLEVSGMFLAKSGRFTLDAFWDGQLLHGSASCPASYFVPLLMLGAAHAASGASSGYVPLGGLFQALGLHAESVAFGVCIAALAVIARGAATESKRRRFFHAARLIAAAAIAGDGIASGVWIYLVATRARAALGPLPVAAVAYLFPVLLLITGSLAARLSSPPRRQPPTRGA